MLLRRLIPTILGRRSCCHSAPSIVYSPFKDVPLSHLSFYDYVYQHIGIHKHRDATVNAITGETWNYGQLEDKTKKFARALKSSPDINVLGIFLPNCMEYPLIFSGASLANVMTTTMNPVYTPREISRQLELSKASAIVTNSELYPIVKQALKLLNNETCLQVITTDLKVDNCLHLDEMIAQAEDVTFDAINVHEDIITLPFSSGTTGKPKGVMLTHFNLVSNVCQMLDGDSQQNVMEDSTDSNQNVLLCVLPLYHIYAMNVSMSPALRTGSKLAMLPKFDPKTYISSLTKYRPNILHLAPPLVSFLVNNPDVKSSHLDSVNDVIVAAAPVGPALLEQFQLKFPNTTIREGWGMSELSPLGLLAPKNKNKPGSCGVAIPNTKFKIVDVENGANLGPGKRGELCCTGPMVMKGYIDNKEATEFTIKEGWLHSGDIAFHDEEGYIFIVDRMKELIKVKGFQVPPAEIEDLLRTLKGVNDVAVIGIPHQKYGEVPRAYVVRKKGFDGMDEDTVKNFVKENVTSYKQLVGGVEFIDSIPKSAAGKTLRRVLVEKYKAKSATSK